MKNLTNNEFSFFKSLVSLTQEQLLTTVYKALKNKYDNVICTKEFVYAVGDIPIALVAHLDTIFPKPPTDVFYDKEQNVIWSPQGLGADDRAGVFAIFQLLRKGVRPSVIFTTDEEIGAVGAMVFTEMFPKPLSPVNYMIELDRRGTCDCVFYDCINREFIDYVSKFAFIEAWGSFSDICYLAPAWDVAAVNLSVGYQDEHSISETLYVSPLLATIDKVYKMLTEDEIPYFKWVEAANAWWRKYDPAKDDKDYYKAAYGYDYEDDFLFDVQHGFQYHENPVQCVECKQFFAPDDMFDAIVDEKGTKESFCLDCASEKIQWCCNCGAALSTHLKTCPICHKDPMVNPYANKRKRS